jgi:Dolichyl-phosphate-mannose-protein mannosyltransferase
MTVGRGSPAPSKPGTDLGAAAAAPGASPFDRRVIGVGGVVLVVLMTLSRRYGFAHDELYFLACAQHLQASYVDQPVLTPLLAWVSLKLFGLPLPGLRVWPALAAWATVVVAGLTAREFGGGRRAQLLAATGTATMPVLLAADHLADPTAYDLLAWAGLALLAARIGRTGKVRWWLAGGTVLGLGLATSTAWACSPLRWSPASCCPVAGGWPGTAGSRPARWSRRRSPFPTSGGRQATSGRPSP